MSYKTGLVIKTAGDLYTVLSTENKKIQCKVTGKYRLEGLKSTNPVVVCDHVEYSFDEVDQFGRITDVKERKNYIIKKSSNLSKTYQVIAANLDQLLLMATIVGLVLGICLYVINLPYMILMLCSSFFRERLCACLGLKQMSANSGQAEIGRFDG